MATIEKRIWPANFDAVLSGAKTYEPRLQDFTVAVGDTLILREWDPKIGTYTGRQVEKKVSEVLKLSAKEMRKYWTQEEIEKFGIQVIHFAETSQPRRASPTKRKNVSWFFFFLAVTLIGAYIVFPDFEGTDHLFSPQEVRLLAVGDMFFDRHIRTVGEQKGPDYLFSCMEDDLRSYDLVFGNLESPITDNPSVSQGTEPGGENNYTFTSPPWAAPLLYENNIRLVNLGNNHMLNFSQEGLLDTKKYLDRAKVAYFGDPDSPEEGRVARMEIKGIPVSFVNWSDWTSDKTDHTVAQVRKEAAAHRVVIVYTHWGEEYVAPLPRMKSLAHSFVDAGASIVIGSHPHIVQEHELYKEKSIYYSLGNFIFDQYFDDSVSHGLALDLTVSREGVSVKERPVVLNRDGRTCFEKAL